MNYAEAMIQAMAPQADRETQEKLEAIFRTAFLKVFGDDGPAPQPSPTPRFEDIAPQERAKWLELVDEIAERAEAEGIHLPRMTQ